MSDNRLKIGITQGDTNGIGWEVILKTLADSRIAELCTPVVYGSPAAAGYYRRCIADLEEIAFNTVSSARDARRGRVNLIACGPQELRIVPGEPSPEAGRAAVEALQAAVRDLKEGTLDALVTGPIDKETAQADDFRYTGHTEYLAAELEGSPMMLMCSDRLRVGLVTTHLPLAEVSAAISREKITEALDRLARSLVADFGVVKPRIAVLALNPHAGDGGLLGREEEETIRPAVNDLRCGRSRLRAFRCRRLFRQRQLRALRRRAGNVPRPGAGALQDAHARRRELHGRPVRGAHLARPRRGLRHRRP